MSSRRDRSRTPLIPIDPDYSDLSGHISVAKGDLLDNGRYEVLGPSGQGTFGTVLKCYDTKRKVYVAIKAVRAISKYTEAGYVEADILSKIRDKDVDDTSRCVKLLRIFEQEHRRSKHLFMVFEKLGGSLFDFIRNNDYVGFNMGDVKSFAKQILQGVAFCHKINLIHTDLKPENILFVNSDYKRVTLSSGNSIREPLATSIRLIDFGGSTFNSDHHAQIINTRQYRAPEVILGVPWSFPSDCWSVGCILAELYTGEMLFPTHDDAEHLAMMEKITESKIPQSLYNAALAPYRKEMRKSRSRHRSRSSSYHRRTRSNSNSRHSKSRSPRDGSVISTPTLSPIRPLKHAKRSSSCPRADRLLHFRSNTIRWSENATAESVERVNDVRPLSKMFSKYPDFADLLSKLLRFDQRERITAEDALNHPFFTNK